MSDPGFWIEEGVLSPRECDSLARTLSACRAGRGRAGARHLMAHPAAAEAANEPPAVLRVIPRITCTN